MVVRPRLKRHVLKAADTGKQIAVAVSLCDRHYQSSLGALDGLVTCYLMSRTHDRKFAMVWRGWRTTLGDYYRKFSIRRFSLTVQKKLKLRRDIPGPNMLNNPVVIFKRGTNTSFGRQKSRSFARSKHSRDPSASYDDFRFARMSRRTLIKMAVSVRDWPT